MDGFEIDLREEQYTVVVFSEDAYYWDLTSHPTEVETLIADISSNKVVCIDADAILYQEEKSTGFLPTLCAFVAALATRGHVVALLNPTINFGTFQVIKGGRIDDLAYEVGDLITPTSYEGGLDDSR